LKLELGDNRWAHAVVDSARVPAAVLPLQPRQLQLWALAQARVRFVLERQLEGETNFIVEQHIRLYTGLCVALISRVYKSVKHLQLIFYFNHLN
jgi:hypothetical protein